jgi:hypothetical protein
MSVSRAGLAVWLSLGLGLGAGCSSSSSSSSGNGISPSSCYKQCDAQDQAQGCKPLVDNATCRSLCDGLVSQLPAGCASQFSTYYDCSAKAGFSCFGQLVGQQNVCVKEQDALKKCQKGGALQCEGALDGGYCPRVACPCPGGTTPVSGFDNGPGGCKCFDTVTCKFACG